MAKKDTEKKLAALLERERKLKEEMKDMRRQMQKEEREERRRCYLEIGKIVESCLPRNFCEDDIDIFSRFAMENEELILSYFENGEAEEKEEDAKEYSADDDFDEEYEEELEEEADPPFRS